MALQIEAPARLPLVKADLALMEQVLENLVGNALQHTPPGGRVRLALRADGPRLEARVADTGGSELPFIFDRHYRGANAASVYGSGAGLGLAIAQRILQLHGAAIGVDSEPAVGTCFHFSLPLMASGRGSAGGGPAQRVV